MQISKRDPYRITAAVWWNIIHSKNIRVGVTLVRDSHTNCHLLVTLSADKTPGHKRATGTVSGITTSATVSRKQNLIRAHPGVTLQPSSCTHDTNKSRVNPWAYMLFDKTFCRLVTAWEPWDYALTSPAYNYLYRFVWGSRCRWYCK